MHKIGRTVKRRRKQQKTDYKARLGLLKSEKLRLIIRKSNKFVVMQIVESEIAQDKVLFSVTSKDLLKLGWPKEKEGSLKSLPACYLTGILLGKKVKGKEVVLDLGLQRNIHKGRIYAALKGAIEGGIKINFDEETLPSDEMLERNEKIKDIVKKIKEKI
ncbi:hypothetical protein AUJ84_03165 [Candidatus Pacearchaeota archaeon CG1_02_32_132]|nr:MAG: hypothetical protein AUJ84_03165 [Candidatus Pacearchaeota archaeon CG1_02_32_132]